MALKESGITLVADAYDEYLKKMREINKAHREAFSTDPIKKYDQAVKASQAQSKKLTQSTKSTWDVVSGLRSKMDDAAQSTSGWQGMLGNLTGFLKGGFASALTSIGGVIAGVFAVSTILNFVSNIKQAARQGLEAFKQMAVASNAQFEKFETQYTTLLGTTGAAKNRIQELAKFNIATPFELPEIVQADKTLQTFGGTALATQENLQLVGDASAAVGTDIQGTSFWVGRLYSAMKNGQPFGEAASRMQELGLMTGETRIKLEAMQKQGATADQLWQAFSQSLQVHEGAMEKLSKTYEGVLSNLSDLQGELVRTGGKKYFEQVRDDTIRLYDILGNDEVSGSLISIAKGIGEILAASKGISSDFFITTLENIDYEKVDTLGKALQDLGAELSGVDASKFEISDLINKTIDALTVAVDVANIFVQGLREVTNAAGQLNLSLGRTIDTLAAFDPTGFFDAIKGAKDFVGDLGLISPVLRAGIKREEELEEAVEETTEAIEEQTGAQQDLTKATEEAEKALKKQITALEATANALKKAEDIDKKHKEATDKAWEDYQKGVSEATANYQKEQEQMIQDHNKAVMEFDAETARERSRMVQDFQFEQMNKEREFALQRQQAEKQFSLQQTQNERQFYANRERELKRHQLAMEQARRRFAVSEKRLMAEGDVLGLMEAREDFGLQQQESQENFGLGQEDATSQFEEQKKIAEENFKLQEQMARESYELQSQIQRDEFAKRLQDFDESRALEREKLLQSNQEELDLLATKFEEEKAKLLEQYEERMQMALEHRDEQYKQLGESLEDQGKITEEGMEKIAEILEETFGPKAASSLMQGWADSANSVLSDAISEIEGQVEQLKATMEEGLESMTTPSANFGFNSPDRGGSRGSRGRRPRRGMRQGGVGVVTGPALFEIEPGQKEAFAFMPIQRVQKNINIGGSADINIKGGDKAGSQAVGQAVASVKNIFKEATLILEKRDS